MEKGTRKCRAISTNNANALRAAYRREGIDSVPVRVPVIHDHVVWWNPGSTKLLRNIMDKLVEPWGAIRRADVQVLFRACDLHQQYYQHIECIVIGRRTFSM